MGEAAQRAELTVSSDCLTVIDCMHGSIRGRAMNPQFKEDSFKFFVCRHRRLARAALAIGMLTFGATTCSAIPPQSAQPDSPVHFAQGDFSIPFQVKPGGRCPQQLDLLISRDGGRTWQVHQSAAPAEGRFRLAQLDEGQYWLKVQARDSAGSSLSPTTMLCTVDKTGPKSNIECDWQGDNKLLVDCKVEDLHLDTQSLQLTLRTDREDGRTNIPLQIRPESPTTCSCQAVIDVPDCKSFELRLTASDKAGNKLASSERYFHPVLATNSDALLPPAADPPASEKTDEQSEGPRDPSPWTAIELGSPTTLTRAQLTSADSSRSIVRKSQKPRQSQPEELIPPQRPEQLMLEAPANAVQLPESSLPASSQTNSTQSVAPPATHLLTPTAPTSPSNVPLPEALTVQTPVQSASRKIKINYALAQVVPNDQLNVELWVTTDRGASWEYWGLDRDSQSPAWIEVERNGEYGFCVVCVHSESDIQFRPKPGDKPDLTVHVNEPPARRRLTPAARD